MSQFLELAIPFADAVAAAHQEGITHRDLKPDNARFSLATDGEFLYFSWKEDEGDLWVMDVAADDGE